MERKIGEIFEYNGEWYQCLENNICRCDYCDYCDYGELGDCNKIACASGERSDNKEVCFKKLEKVGEPYVKRVSDGTFSTFQRYRVYNSVILPKEPYIYCNFIDSTIEIEVKQTKEDMEEKKLNLKPFDIQKAREGKPVCTMDGRKARIICFDANGDYPIIALITLDNDAQDIKRYTVGGRYYGSSESNSDLMMLSEKKEGWVNVYYDNDASSHRGCRFIYDTKERAVKEAGSNYITTVKINWEE